MKRLVAVMLTIALLLSLGMGAVAESSEEKAVKDRIKAFFDLKYKVLSTLTLDDKVKDFIAPELTGGEAVHEGNVLDAIVQYRKMQMNDLRFERYSYNLLYQSVKIEGDKAWATFKAKWDLYFKCAPTVKNTGEEEHVLTLRNIDGNWLILNDEYNDMDGIKKKLVQTFLENSISVEEAVKRVLAESEGRVNSRITKLDRILGGQKDKNLFVFSIGKNVAYAMGKAEKIDSEAKCTPILSNGIPYLPIRYICGKLGWEVKWEDASKTLWIKNEKIALKSPAKLLNGEIFIPAASAAGAVGKKLFWDRQSLIVLSGSAFNTKANTAVIKQLSEFFSVLFTKADFPKIDGSTATYPFSMEMGKELLGLDETGVKGFITHKTTHNAYVNLINGDADLIFVTQPSPDEYALAKKKGVTLEIVPFCKEGFVFLVNKENKVKSLTVKQVQDIYQGKIKNWKNVGGENSSIIAYQREANSGSQTQMEVGVMKGLRMMNPPKETVIVGMGELIDRVADYSNAKNALGYSFYYYATQMYQNRNVKLLSINGIAPEKQTIQSGKYPFTTAYYAVIRASEPKNSNTRKLLNWVLGQEGQQIVNKAGFVPVKGGLR